FRRSDLPNKQTVPALWSFVADTKLGTVLKGSDGASIGVVEHLLSALAGAEIEYCLIEVDGPEPPILDGDALSFLKLIDKAGARETEEPRDSLRVVKAVSAAAGSASARLLPAPAREFLFEIDFPSAVIGIQKFECVLTP